MTERAKRAAEELHHRGWNLYSTTETECVPCGAELSSDDRYCGQCGALVRFPGSTTLEDLEAAIAAALDPGPGVDIDAAHGRPENYGGTDD